MKKLWIRKKALILFGGITILVGCGILSVKSCAGDWIRHLSGLGEYTYPNVNYIDEDSMKRFCSFLEIEKFPEGAEDIYIYAMGAVSDKTVYCSMTLPAEEVPKFAKYFIGVPISAFKDGIDSKDDTVSHKIYMISKGATFDGLAKNIKTYWDLKEIKNAKYFEVIPRTKVEFKEKFREVLKKDGLPNGIKVKEEDLDEETELHYNYYSRRFIAIDMDTNRVYLCVQ